MRILQFTNREDLEVLTKKLPKCKSDEDYKLAGDIRDKMTEICKNNNGVGLSSNQIGIEKRFFIIKTDKLDGLFINPVILGKMGAKGSMEGCLSFANGKKSYKQRFTNIRVQFENKDRKKIEMDIKGFEAIIFQHELDHMDGKII